MQPKTETLPNGKEVIVDDGGKSHISPAEQWDHVAFRLIQQELAPKGYSEIKRGAYRGSVQANIPFLQKKTVQNCQKISAQLVRTFRMRLGKEVAARIDAAADGHIDASRRLAQCHFWQGKTKRDLRKRIECCKIKIDTLQAIINDLNFLPIK